MMSSGIMASPFRTRKGLSRIERLLWWGCQDLDKRELERVSDQQDNFHNAL